LACCDYPLLVVEVLPSIMRESTKQEIEKVLNAYKQLIQQDRDFLVPVIGSLSEFDLPSELKVIMFHSNYSFIHSFFMLSLFFIFFFFLLLL
jgi:hypothetical protein